jgi:NAD(P)H-dependent flavin oxidoreductase YrpB (nitropropane dioxygenase family)
MGVGVSGWRLARAVALTGQLGVVSGVGLEMLLARRLQLGDEGGQIRRALNHFPAPAVAGRILDRYFVAGGIPADQPFRPLPKLTVDPARGTTDLIVAANFVEVFLAKDGHGGLVGVNYLEKVQMSSPAAVYGAMLAGADFVLVGAGIPAEFPHLLDDLAAGRDGKVTVDVVGAGEAKLQACFSPGAAPYGAGELGRPRFIAIVASHVLASYLARDPGTRPDGFVVEGPSAGGHSAPPRGPLSLDEDGQPVYGPRDNVDIDKINALGLPYWLAGGYASPQLLAEAKAAGAVGAQVGSAFALCEESNLDAGLRQALVRLALAGELRVRADPLASPTGFPFKLADLPGTVAHEDVFASRQRVCDASYLRSPYLMADGSVGYRCPAGPVPSYLRNGGEFASTVGRRCLCNGLMAAIGLAQRRGQAGLEPPAVTIGQDLGFLPELLSGGRQVYRAADVVAYLLGRAGSSLSPS